MKLHEIADDLVYVLTTPDLETRVGSWRARLERGKRFPPEVNYLVLAPPRNDELYRILPWGADGERIADWVLEAAGDAATLAEALALLPWIEAPALDGGLPAATVYDVAVVLAGGEVRGVADLRPSPDPDSRSVAPGVCARAAADLPGLRRYRSPIPWRGSADLGADGDFAAPDEDAGDAPEDFSAHPRLDAPARVRPGESFEVVVGFRREEDPDLDASRPIRIENPPPDARVWVVLFTDGLDLEGSPHRSLELELAAHASYRLTARDIDRARVSVDYLYDGQVVGSATREIAVRAAPRRHSDDGTRELGPVTEEAAVDLTLTIRQGEDEHLEWTLVAPRPETRLGPIRRRFEGTREFAASLLDELKPLGFKGFFAYQVLLNKGQAVADAMPREVFETLRAVHREIGRRPTLLLRTEDTYVPWELALLEQPLDPGAPPFLGAQTEVGRWLRHDRVPDPPPVLLELERCTVVASQYGRGSGQRELVEAPEERRSLLELFGGYRLLTRDAEARLEALEPIVSEPASPGHLIHFAAHGLSDPEAADHLLLLADQNRLPSSALMGRYRPGDVPRFSFVFLNACQLGTAGRSLGQAAGFPGDVIRGGASGFVAPLWEVHDRPARELAESFYRRQLAGEVTVSSFVAEQKAGYRQKESTTPMAYVYYGHPKLRVRARSEEEENG